MKQRAWNLLVALDQFAFCLLTLGGSMPDETASAAAYRSEAQGHWAGCVFRPLIDAIFWFDPEHCRESFRSEVERRQLPQGYDKTA